jgi:hypothetical protein
MDEPRSRYCQKSIHQIPLMRYKGSINDYIYKDYLYSDGGI